MEGLLLCLTPLVDLIKLGNESGNESDRTFRTARSIKAKVSYVSVRIGNQKTAAASVSSVSDRLSSYPFLLLNKLPLRMYPTVNTNLSNPLIYDFYGFPKHFYAQTFQSSFSDEHVSDVEKQLSNAGWTVDRTDRGLDHGLWGRFMLLQHTHTLERCSIVFLTVPFKVAFRQEAQNTQTPSPPTADVIANTPSIIQLSLPGNSDEHTTLKLGQTLSGLRDQGYAIVATGQAVHNLRDLSKSLWLDDSTV
jgi:hypothetical protein